MSGDIEAEAFEQAKVTYRSYEFAFRKRYNLPPTDPRFLTATRAQIIEDCWAHAFAEDKELIGKSLAWLKGHGQPS